MRELSVRTFGRRLRSSRYVRPNRHKGNPMRFVTRVRAVVFAVAVSLAIALPGQALAKDGNHGNHCGKGHAKHSRAVGKSCSKHHHSSAASRRHHGAVTAAVTTRGDEQSGSDDDAT